LTNQTTAPKAFESGTKVNGFFSEGVIDQEVNKTKIRPLPKPAGQPKNVGWKDYLVTSEPLEVPVLIKIGSAPVATAGNHSLIIGKKKSRKTLFLVWLISKYTGNKATDVLICDSEQGKKHVWKTKERVKTLTKQDVHILSLRGLDPLERRAIIEAAVMEGKFKLVIIDGIRDLLSNINDADQCTELITWIESLTVANELHVINVLHLNKTDGQARGHIGTELLNKAEITIELELDEKANCTIVKCESSRDIPFETFAFTHNSDELPEVVLMPVKGTVMADSERKERLQHVFEGELLKYAEVLDGIKLHFDVGATRAEKLIAEFKRLGWIVLNGKPRSPDAVYKLMVTPLKPAL
jgi:hypothetical protein